MENYFDREPDIEEKVANACVLRLENLLGKKELMSRVYNGMREVGNEEALDFDSGLDLDHDNNDEWSDDDWDSWSEHELTVTFDSRCNSDSGALDAVFELLTEEENKYPSFVGSALKTWCIRYWGQY